MSTFAQASLREDAVQRLSGFDALTTAVLVVDASGCVALANLAAEALTELSRKNLVGQRAWQLFEEAEVLNQCLQRAQTRQLGVHQQQLVLRRALGGSVLVQAVFSTLNSDRVPLLIELSAVEQHIKVSREAQQLDLSEASRMLLRNLAHEIKNPLGGIRGAAQLLARELPPEQQEYTRVIIDEADRLQSLVDRLLAPHRHPKVVEPYNLHEICERVRTVILAEFGPGLVIERDYDASVPEALGDKEQLIQAILNIVRNAAQALEPMIEQGCARIVLRTRIARQVTIARHHHRLALDLHVIDNGPGVPESLCSSVFYPLVSGRAGGSGLGLALAQTYVQGNDGVIEFESRPGHTDFRVLLPLHPSA